MRIKRFPALFAFLIGGMVLMPGVVWAQSETMRQWHYVPSSDGNGCELGLREVPTPQPGPGEIQVRIRATSLNGRDRGRLDGNCLSPTGAVQIPLSDGAGEVIGVGPGVTRFAVGDRVVGAFFAEMWLDGDRPEGVMAYRRGGPGEGMLSEVVVGHQDGFVTMPSHLSFEEGATLTTAAVTAYNALFKYRPLQPNEFVLLEGTGGVSMFGLQIADAYGARPIITSSSDDKLARATELGAVGTVNYRDYPEWHEEVLKLTDGLGVKHVLEIGGRGTLPRALQSIAIGGHITLIGGLDGGFADAVSVAILSERDVSVSGIRVGSRADFEALNRFLEGHRIHPVVDRVFEMEDAPEGFDFYLSGEFFMGKVVIRL